MERLGGGSGDGAMTIRGGGGGAGDYGRMLRCEKWRLVEGSDVTLAESGASGKLGRAAGLGDVSPELLVMGCGVNSG